MDCKLETMTQKANLNILQHNNLNDNPKFKELKASLVKFYRNPRNPTRREPLIGELSLKSQDRFFKSLQVLLTELVHTETAESQDRFLDNIYKWYKSKIVRENPVPIFIHQLPKTPKPLFLSKEVKETDTEKLILTPKARIPKTLKVKEENKSRFAQSNNNDPISLKTTERRSNFLFDWDKQKLIQDLHTKNILSKSLGNIPKTNEYLNFAKNRSKDSKIVPIPNFIKSPHKKTYVINSVVLKSKNKMIEEVISAKNKLAKKKLNVPVEKLETGILLPKINHTRAKVPLNLPKGGEMLLSKEIF